MNKRNNLIRVDDLVRQKLEGREEAARPGAWMAMRELLEQQAPVATVFWNKRNISLLLLLLFTGITAVGGLLLQSSPVTDGVQMTAQQTGTSAEPLATSRGTGGVSSPVSSPVSSHSPSILQSDNNGHQASHSSANPNRNPIPPTYATRSRNITAVSSALDKSTAPDLLRSNVVNSSDAVKFEAPQKDWIPGIQKELPLAVLRVFHPQPMKVDLERKSFSFLSYSSPSGADHIPGVKIIPPVDADNAAGTQLSSTHKTSGQPKLAANGSHKTIRDTLPSTTVVQRYVRVGGKMQLLNDTVDQGIAIIEKQVPVLDIPVTAISAPDPQIVAARKVVLPEYWEPTIAAAKASDANPAISAKGLNNMQLLATKRVSTKYRKLGDISVQDWLRNTSFALSQIHVNMGMTAGVNTAPFGDVKQSGFHVGMTAAFVINDTWSFFTELRYNRKMAGNTTIADDYIRCSPYSSTVAMVNGVPTTTYSWTEDSIEHYYTLAGVHYLDLPLSVRYNYRRLFVLAGINLSYAFAANAEEREYKVSSGVQKDYSIASQYANGFVPGYDVREQQIFGTDFGSRFGMGYQLGLGYAVSPAIDLDLRISKQFWDDARTSGARQVSQLLYHAPVLQLSIGYRFGQRQ